MIGEIRAFCLMACAVSLLSVMIRAITPDRLRRQVEMAANLFLLLCLLTPLAQISLPDFWAMSTDQAASVQGLGTDAMFEREVKRRLEKTMGEKLKENGIFPEEIRIDITVADDRIEINSALVVLRTEDGQYSQRARALSEQLLGVEVLVGLARR